RAARAAAAESREEIGEVRFVEREGAFAETPSEVLLPVRRRTEVLAAAVRAELVVGGALLLILQGLVGFADLLELLFRVGFLGNVRVILVGEPAVRLLDVVRTGVPGYPEGRVVVLVFHLRREWKRSGKRRSQALILI